jgi:hypothetical protein
MFEAFSERARKALDLDTDIHISGNREVVIDNCRRIEEYNEVFMRISTGRLWINIRGSGLRAYDFRTGGLVVRGSIEQIEFERSQKNEADTSGQTEGKRKRKKPLQIHQRRT